MKAPRPGTCPTCGKPAPFVPDNPWRPFCSERCRSVDLGAWASEAYRIPEAEPNADPGEASPDADVPDPEKPA